MLRHASKVAPQWLIGHWRIKKGGRVDEPLPCVHPCFWRHYGSAPPFTVNAETQGERTTRCVAVLEGPAGWMQQFSSCLRIELVECTSLNKEVTSWKRITVSMVKHHLMIGTWTPPGVIITVAFDDEMLKLELVQKTDIPKDEPISWMAFDVRAHFTKSQQAQQLIMGFAASKEEHIWRIDEEMELSRS
jgi:hypothetical protein